MNARHTLPGTLVEHLSQHAEAIDQGRIDPQDLLTHLGQAQLLRVGVAVQQGGSGGDVCDAVEAIAALAEHSMATAFVCWGQRAFIEYLLQSPNQDLAQRLLPDLLAGTQAGATGLSNAMKFLSGVEQLQIEAQDEGEHWRLNGGLHWVTNLHQQGFWVAAAVSRAGAETPAVVAVDSRLPGVHRTNDLDLIALRGTQTAALRLENVDLPTANVIHPDARAFLPSVRPAFLALQCGMSIGLARAALHAADKAGAEHHGLGNDVRELSSNLEQTISALYQGVRNGSFKTHAAPLFRLRIALADLAQKAVQLELMSSGGKAYLTAHGQAFARRWREVAFVPIVTPSLSQLKAELARHDLIQGKAA